MAILVAALVGSVAPVAAATAIATPTAAELATLTSDVNAYYSSGTISSAGLYGTLSSDLSSASSALDRGNIKAATNAVQTFINDTNAQSGKKIASWAASVLTSIARTGTAPSSTVVPLSATTPTLVTTQVTGPTGGIQNVSMNLPAGLTVGGVAVASVTIKTPTRTLGAFSPIVSAVQIDATSASGSPLHSFDGSVTVGVTVSLPVGAPTGLAAAADDPITGAPQSLPLTVSADRTTATITTPHFSILETGKPTPPPPPPAPTFTAESSGMSATLRGVSCSSSACMAVGDGGSVTYNGGSGWSAQATGVSANLTGVACDATACHVTADDGSIRTTGPSFGTPEPGTPASSPARVLRGITCAGGTCVAVGDGGTILTSIGSGWTPVASGTTNNLNAVGCWSNGSQFECAAVGDSGTVLSSTSPTASWTVAGAPPGNPNLYGATCVAALECHGVGSGGFVGPGTQSSGTTATLRAVACKGPGQCLAAGDGGTVIYTADGGANWWAAASSVTAHLYGAECFGSTCRIVGAGGTIVRVT